MDYSKATKQQLHDIAKDENARMKDRYAAARELQERKMKMCKCQYPQCALDSEKSWGLVPLCKTHHNMIKEEAESHYAPTDPLKYQYRYHYLKIAPQIPWSRAKKEGIV